MADVVFVGESELAGKLICSSCRVADKVGKACANKTGMGSEHGTMKQDDGFGFAVWGVAEVIDVAIGAEAADNFGPRRGVNGVALGPDGDFAVVADAHAGLVAPDVGPPRAVGRGANDGAFFGEGLLVRLTWGLAEFAVDFMLVGVGDELVEQVVGPDQFADLVGGQEGYETFLPVVVPPLDFAFGLRRRGVEELDAVEVEGLAQAGEGVGDVGVEEGVVVHVEGQGQAVGLEDAGQEVEVSQEGFARVEACAGVEAGGVVENVQEDLFVVVVGQPGVGAGVVLPEGAVVAGLPALDGFGRGLVAGVGGEVMFQGPAADAGAVGLEVEAAQEFTGGGAVRAGRFGVEELGEQRGDFRRPSQVMIAPGEPGRPGLGTALSAGEQVAGAQLVDAAQTEAQFESDGFGGQQAGASLGEEMTDQRWGDAVSELEFFIAGR